MLTLAGLGARPDHATAQIQVKQGAADLISLSITSITNAKQPGSNPLYATIGDTVVVHGTGLASATVSLRAGYEQSSRPSYAINPKDTMLYPVTKLSSTQTSVRFVVPVVPVLSTHGGDRSVIGALEDPYYLIVTRGTKADTSKLPILVSPPNVVRKITSVEEEVIFSTGAPPRGRVRIHGTGFRGDWTRGTVDVKGGYFGVGAAGSTTNPLITAANLSDTYVELWVSPTCSQRGILMLTAGARPGRTEDLVFPDKPIYVACTPYMVEGEIDNSQSYPRGALPVEPGSSISISGKSLDYVTGVVNAVDRTHYPFKIVQSPNRGATLLVTLPAARPGPAYSIGFALENSLTGKAANGNVIGAALVMAAPSSLVAVTPWAEPGQLVKVTGRDIAFTKPPLVMVGGVPAQVTQWSDISVSFRLATTTTTGPVTIQNEVGTSQLTDPSTNGTGFVLVAGPSIVQSIASPAATLAYNDILTIKGQNLARLNGICLDGIPALLGHAGYVTLRRVQPALGAPVSNTQMQVTFDTRVDGIVTGSEVQVYAPTEPPGDTPPSKYACTASAPALTWPSALNASVAAPPSAPPPPPSPPPAAPPQIPPADPGSAADASTLSLALGLGTALVGKPLCTEGTKSLAVTGFAPGYSVAVAGGGTHNITCRFVVSSPVEPPAAKQAGDPGNTPAPAQGAVRLTLPNGTSEKANASFVCTVADGKTMLMVIFASDGGIMGGIAGKLPHAAVGTYDIAQDEDQGLTAGISRIAAPVESFPASTGTVTITEWTKTILRGSFRYTGDVQDAEGTTRKQSLSGTFSAVASMGC